LLLEEHGLLLLSGGVLLAVRALDVLDLYLKLRKPRPVLLAHLLECLFDLGHRSHLLQLRILIRFDAPGESSIGVFQRSRSAEYCETVRLACPADV
jgi:hypothetical protein